VAWLALAFAMPAALVEWVVLAPGGTGFVLACVLFPCFWGFVAVVRLAVHGPHAWGVAGIVTITFGVVWAFVASYFYAGMAANGVRHLDVERLAELSPPSGPVYLTVRDAELARDLAYTHEVERGGPNDDNAEPPVTAYSMIPVRSAATRAVSPAVFAGHLGTREFADGPVSGFAVPISLDAKWVPIVRGVLGPAVGVDYRADALRLEPSGKSYEAWLASETTSAFVMVWLVRLLALAAAAGVVTRDD
jgi:hypothetical protein